MTDKTDNPAAGFRLPEHILQGLAKFRADNPAAGWGGKQDEQKDSRSLPERTAEAERARRISIAEEEERARLRVREEWERSQLQPEEHQQSEGQNATGRNEKSRRSDAVQVEIEDLLSGMKRRGEHASPARVMAALRARAGRPDSCISETCEEGVIWTRGTSGAPEKLTMSALKSRIHRLGRALG